MITSHTMTRDKAYGEYKSKLASGDYDIGRSRFFEGKNGMMLVHKGRKDDPDESAVAEAMAKDGLIVELTPEGGVKFSTGKNAKGNPVYADGLVNGYSYEQATKKPSKFDSESLSKSVDKALKHAYDKRAQIPLIYDKYGSYHRENIEDGLSRFEKMNQYRFKAILVVDKYGNIWVHQHNI